MKHISTLKDKNMINRCRKSIWQSYHPFIKTAKWLGKEGVDHNTIRTKYDNSTSKNMKVKKYCLKLQTRQRCGVSSLLFNTALEFLTRTIKKKRHTNWRSQIIFFRGHDLIWGNHEEPTEATVMRKVGKFAAYKIYTKQLVAVVYETINYKKLPEKPGIKSHLQYLQKEMLRNKFHHSVKYLHQN